MTRTRLVIGNWKMELSHKGSVDAATSFKTLLAGFKVTADVIICPSFVELPALKEVFGRSEKVMLGAQNVHWVEKGPWTGEVSVLQLVPYIQWCIVGHSERRALTGETDEQVGIKTNLLLTHNINPIVCIGETVQEREQDQTVAKITHQIKMLLDVVDRASLTKIVIAYEPIWAIGTGDTPEPSEAAGTMLLIRKLIAEHFDSDLAERIRIIYGGSVKPATVSAFVSEPGVDGVLVGGASVHPMDFIEIIKQVQGD